MLNHESGKNTKNCEAVLLKFLFSVIIRRYFVLAFSRLKSTFCEIGWKLSVVWHEVWMGHFSSNWGVDLQYRSQGYIAVVTRERVNALNRFFAQGALGRRT